MSADPTDAAAFAGVPVLDLRDESRAEDHATWRARCGRAFGLDAETDAGARRIVEAVRDRGDAAVAEFTRTFEHRELAPAAFEITRASRQHALAHLDATVRAALEDAAGRIRRFHETQRPDTTGYEEDGTALHSRVSPLRRVALYAPGGTAAYPSSVLMAGIPAKVAGVDELIMLTPRPSPVVLAAAEIAGVDRVFGIGGAQAIAAAAFGTDRVPKVDKIVGPGNAWVTAAKRLVFGVCDIDSIAGPSEILIIADDSADPEVVAADLISQAEHDLLASAILVTDAPALVEATNVALVRQVAELPRAHIAGPSLREHGAAVLVTDRAAMIAASEAFAPEHLELLVRDAETMAAQLRNAGAIFVGPWTPEAAGDYTAGPSHVLPTAGGARFASPLGVWDFVKYTSMLRLSEASLRAQARSITTLARAEGLEGHARAVDRRVPPTHDEGGEA